MKNMQKKQQRWLRCGVLGLAISAPLMAPLVAKAQPNVGGGQGQNPPNQNPGGGGANRPDFRNMTPEQRQQFFEQMQDRMLRGLLDRAGYNNAAQQDAVVAYAKVQGKSSQSLQDMADKLVTAVSTPGVPDTEVARLLKEFQDAVAKEKERRIAARADLDKTLNYTKQPRLEMVLTMLGIVGDDSLALGNMGGRFMGFGGGAGGFGGRGGQAGPQN